VDDAARRHLHAKGDGVGLPPKEASVEQPTAIGLDIPKHVFRVHGADVCRAVLLRKRVTRAKLIGFLAAQTPRVVAMDSLRASWAIACD
jgi:hypothetical protein